MNPTMSHVRLVSILAMLAVSPALLEAQAARAAESPAAPAAYGWSGGAGAGWTRVSCSICTPRRVLGPTAHLRVGTFVRPGLLLGAEANGWMRDQGENGRAWTAAIGPVAYLYPKAAGPFHIKAGIGYMTYNAEEDVSTSNVAVQLGAGYEFRVGSRLHLTNYANLHASSFGSLKSDGDEVVGDVSVSLFQIGVGLTRR